MINVDVTKMSVNVFSARGQKFSAASFARARAKYSTAKARRREETEREESKSQISDLKFFLRAFLRAFATSRFSLFLACDRAPRARQCISP
jgi:hypothetical protein